jgi:hypothetical protein
MVQMVFNAEQYDPSTGTQDVFETGEYTFHIVGSEPQQTKNGGTMLVFEMACLDEGFTGKRLKARLNIVNSNPQAVDIAYRELSAISHVVGVLTWQDTQQLHGRPFRVRVEKVPRSDDASKFGNEIRAYMDVNGNAPSKGVAAGAAPGGPPAPPQAPPAPPAAPPAAAPVASAPPMAAPPAAPPAAAPAAVAPAPQPWNQAPPVGQPGAAPVAQAQAAVPPWQQPAG